MTNSQVWSLLIAGIGLGFTILSAILYAVKKITTVETKVDAMWDPVNKIASIESKVDTMWDFLMRRAMSEAITKNVGRIKLDSEFESDDNV